MLQEKVNKTILKRILNIELTKPAQAAYDYCLSKVMSCIFIENSTHYTKQYSTTTTSCQCYS